MRDVAAMLQGAIGSTVAISRHCQVRKSKERVQQTGWSNVIPGRRFLTIPRRVVARHCASGY